MYVGLGASRVRELFKEIKKSRPAMLFIDEIDAVGRKRGNGHSGGNDEREQTLNQLLVEMDGFETNTGLVIMAATNRADVLDDALLRPGRFDRQVEVSLPDLKTREKILRLHAARIKYSNKIDFEEIARNTSGMSGAELANIINEAAILAVREGKKGVGKEEMREAIDRVIVGLAKKSRKYTEKDKQIVSYHESGHVIAGIVTSNGKEVEKVTIVPRGNAGGYAIHSETEERFFRTKDDYLDEITVFLAGRAAEEIFVKEISGGAHNDFEHATKIARAMVTELGMTELGIYQYNLREEQMFGLPPKYSEKSAMLIDEKIKEILDFCYDRVTKILLEHSEQMHTMARVLRERESLSRKEILSVYNNGKIESEITEDEEFIVPENKINSFKEEVHNKITKLREFQTGRDYTPSELIHDYEANIYEEYKLYAENMNKLSDIDLTVDEKIKLNEFKAIEVKVTNVVVDYIFEEIVPTLNTNPDQRRLELKIKQRNQIIAKSKNADTAVISDVQIENVIQVEEMLKVRPKETLTEEEKKRINYYYDTILYLGRF